VLDTIMGTASAAVRARILSELSTAPSTPPPPPPPPPPAGITLFGDHDPQQNNRRRSLYKVERLEVDSDFDLIPDHVELADPNANPYDVMNHAFAQFPASATNQIPNAYEALGAAINGAVINEVKLKGGSEFQDEDGDQSDWIEIFNPTNAPVVLDGWQLRDSSPDPTPAAPASGDEPYFTFPAGDPRCTIPSGGYLLIPCRDTNLVTPSPWLRTRWNLSTNGEMVRLMWPNPGTPDPFVMHDEFNTTPTPPDPVTPRYGAIPDIHDDDFSFGRAMWSFHPPGGSSLTYGWFATPTPGAMNTGLWYEGFCSPVTGVTTFNQDNGQPLQTGVNSRAFGARFGAFITGGNPNNGEFIYYTLNGAVPSPWSAVADAGTGAIDLSPDTPFNVNDFTTWITTRGFVVRARTFKAGCVPGPVITRNFLFKEDVLGRVDDPATPGVDETEPRQTRPAGYPELTLPENGTAYTMRYGVQPAWGTAAERAAIATQLSAAPSIAITLPVADSFDRESAGIIAAAAATESGLPNPHLNGWERAASMQWIFEDSVGNGAPLELECGLDVSGRTSLAYSQTLKKGFRLSFKKKYGKGKFQISGPNPVFTGTLVANKYDELVLRGQTGDSWTSAQGSWAPSHASYSRERWARTFMEDAGHFSLKSRHMHVWVNGLYWGVYMLSEVASDDTLDTRVRAADWQIWKDGGEVHEAPATGGGLAGANATWLALTTNAADMATAIQQGGTGDAQWATLQTLMDVDNFCDYVLINGYMGNWDSMWNNGRMYRDPNPAPGFDSRIRWMVYDSEMGANSAWLQNNWDGQPGPWKQNATTGEWQRFGWLGHAADGVRHGPRGMIRANTNAGSNIVTFPKQVTPHFHGPAATGNYGADKYRLVGPGIPASTPGAPVYVVGAVSAPGLTTLTLNVPATATATVDANGAGGAALIHYTALNSAACLLRDLAYHPGFARRLSARAHKHFYDLRPGKVGLLSADAAGDQAVTSYITRSSEFAPFKPCEYLRWGADYTSNGTQPANTWFGIQPDYTVQTYLPLRRGFFTQELQKHPFPAGVQPGPNPQPLYLPLERPLLTSVGPGDPLPPGWSAIKLDPRIQGAGGTNPPGTIIRYTLDGSDPSTVEFPLYSQGQVNIDGVYWGGQPDWINLPPGTVLRACTAIVDYRTSAPPQDSDSIVERIVAESADRTILTVFTP